MAIFGQLPEKPAIIANEIITKVRELVKDGRLDWNKEIRKTLRKLGNDKGYNVYPDPEKKDPGWLLDLIWLDKKTGAVRLAVESEMGKEGEVLDDFQKLLCIKAPLKVMIYYVYREKFLSKFEAYMEKFDQHVSAEHYLFIEFAPGPADHAYECTVDKDGRPGKFLSLRGELKAA